jgi:Type VI immunity for VRR-NUC
MSDIAPTSPEALNDLQLTLNVRSGAFSAVRAGVTLVLYYAKPMRDMTQAVGKFVEEYLAVVPEGSIRSMLTPSGVWREFTIDSVKRRVRRLSADGLDYSSLHISSGAPANVGDYGLHFFGSNLKNTDIKPDEACASIFEFPLMIARDEPHRFIDFAARIAEIEPFESGFGGYAFKHLSETWRDQALAWIGQHAPRYLALDISYDTLRNGARGHVVNVSWLTLLGQSVVAALGGEPAIREKVSPRIVVRPLSTGLMLLVGERPPVGDVNRGATDIGPLKEVAALTKGVRAKVQVGFGGDSFRTRWLNRFD